MDALDIGIIRTMGIFPFGRVPRNPDTLKPGHLAKALGVTPETARERVQRLEMAAVISGYQVYPNLRHFGLESAGFLFQVADEERWNRLPKELKPVDGILGANYFLGNKVCVELSYRGPSDLARRLELISNLSGDLDPVKFWGRDTPSVDRPLTPLDWRILRALRGRARRPLAEVAKELGVGYRTVKRRYDRMANEGSFFVVPVINPGKDPGLIPIWLLFYLRADASGETVREITRSFHEWQIHSHVPASRELGSFDVLVYASSPSHIEALRQRGSAIAGVGQVSALIPCAMTEADAWIDEAIDARLEGKHAQRPRVPRGKTDHESPSLAS